MTHPGLQSITGSQAHLLPPKPSPPPCPPPFLPHSPGHARTFHAFTFSLDSFWPHTHTHARTHCGHLHLRTAHREALFDIQQQRMYLLQVLPGWMALEQHLLHPLSSTETHQDPQIPQLLLAHPGPLLQGQEKLLKPQTEASGPAPHSSDCPPHLPCTGDRPRASTVDGVGGAPGA